MPSFIPRESRRVLFEAGRSLRLLREASGGQHPLCSSSWRLRASWGWADTQKSPSERTLRAHVRAVQHQVEQWRKDFQVQTRLPGSRSSFRLTRPRTRKSIPPEFTAGQATSEGADRDGQKAISAAHDDLHSMTSLWAQFYQAPGSHFVATTAPLWGPTPLASLQSFINDHEDEPIIPSDCLTLDLFITSHLLAPLLAHAKLVSTSLVSVYLDDLSLLEHYDVIRAYFLGGNVDFIERVSIALFGKEAGAGEAMGLGKRARTRARLGLGVEEGRGDRDDGETVSDKGEWGIGLGLGLSERAKWPPGGAELAYALRTTLVDDDPRSDAVKSKVWEGIEDRVSFAVKSLPEDDKKGERARWMDPQGESVAASTECGLTIAIEALDFLYLVYSAPSAITPLLPSSLMAKYQSIHNLLLRICRVRTVLRLLYMDAVHRTPSFDEPVKGPGAEPKRSTASINCARVIHELFPASSVSAATLQRVRFGMSAFMSALEEYILDRAIGANWDVMRRKLERLGRKQAKARAQGQAEVGIAPITPEGEDEIVFHSDVWEEGVVDEEDQADDDDEDGAPGMVQLHSVDSLVTYHHLIVDRILRDALLSPSEGHKVTLDVLMRLFGCILDLGKIVKLVARGSVGWEDGAERVLSIASRWDELEEIFVSPNAPMEHRFASPCIPVP